MKLMVWLLTLSGYMISAHCSLSPLISHPGGIGGIFKGPNSETIIKGPDGSVITSESEGGEIHTRTAFEPIVVAETAVTDAPADVDSNGVAAVTIGTIASFREDNQTPLQVGGSLSVSLLPPPEPSVIAPMQENPHIVETEIVDAPIIEPNQSSDLVGPSGSISTRGSSSVISGPASTTISEPTRVLVAPVIPAVPVVASVTTPLHAPSIVQVNQEIPSALSNPLNSLPESAIYPGPSPITAPPINAPSTIASPLGVDSILPPLDSINPHASWVSPSASPILEGSAISTGRSELRDDAIVFHSTVLPRNQVWSSTITPPDASDVNNNIVQPASSYGIINNLSVEGNTVSTTPSPELLPPDISIQVRGNPQQLLDQTLIENRNIEPPEIGFTFEEAFDLGTEAEVSSVPKAPGLTSIGDSDLGVEAAVSSVPKAPGLASIGDPQDIIIQRNNYNPDTVPLNDEGGYVGIAQERIPEQPQIFSSVDSVQNEVTPVRSRNEGFLQSLRENTQLLRDTQPNAYRIYPVGKLRSENASNVQLVNMAASPVEYISENSPLQKEDVYDDSGTEILWNRYGRRAKSGRQ